MASKPKKKQFYGDYVTAKEMKRWKTKPKTKQLMLEIIEMNKHILEARKKSWRNDA